jgi:hypothetical protein
MDIFVITSNGLAICDIFLDVIRSYPFNACQIEGDDLAETSHSISFRLSDLMLFGTDEFEKNGDDFHLSALFGNWIIPSMRCMSSD